MRLQIPRGIKFMNNWMSNLFSPNRRGHRGWSGVGNVKEDGGIFQISDSAKGIRICDFKVQLSTGRESAQISDFTHI